MPTIQPETFRGRPAVSIQNECLRLVILTGGGHIASASLAGGGTNVLWEPHWPGLEPNLRELGTEEVYGDDPEEGKLLSSIAGHSLCCDVFGAQSEGEVAVGLTFHGEAGMVQWSAVSAEADTEAAVLVMEADLPHTALRISRTYMLRAASRTVRVDETMVNKVGFERALGVSQHATLGRGILGGPEAPALFACNGDRGQTWPVTEVPFPHGFVPDTAFDYPHIPSKDGQESGVKRKPSKIDYGGH